MAISVRQDANKAALDAALAVINTGSGDLTGDFEVLYNSTSLAVMTFSSTAFAASTNGSGTSATATSNTITQSGTPTNIPNTINVGRFRDKANSAVWTFSISAGGGGGDMVVTDPSIPSNATAVSCSGVTVTLNITN